MKKLSNTKVELKKKCCLEKKCVHPLRHFMNFEVNIGGKTEVHLEPYQHTALSRKFLAEIVNLLTTNVPII